MSEPAHAGVTLVDWRRLVAEAIGTFALVAVGPGAAMVSASTHAFGHTSVALAFGLVIAFVVAATHSSLGHSPPAPSTPRVVLGQRSLAAVGAVTGSTGQLRSVG